MRPGGVAALLLTLAPLLHAGPAAAQKDAGVTIPLAPVPAMPRAAPAAPRAPAFVPPTPNLPQAAAPGAQPGAERDAEARQLAAQLPLDPATANLQGRMPNDVRGTTGRLGLRPPNGTTTDLRGQRATREDVINALRH